ncbi:hypothetical protein [Candidatus Poriferisodalis sp.]|uniref:hypothetical protein n=1 Tax=Candidatus Poriferisodalis sp. TaxID=3101277 RepID=UPI003B02ADBD
MVPFEVADYFMSDAIRRLRLPLGGRDLSGPFLGEPLEHIDLLSGVFDLCDDAEAYEAFTGETYREGSLFPRNTYPELISERGTMGCDGSGTGVDQPRWALRANDWGGTIRFATREDALAEQEERIARYSKRYANTVETPPLGIHDGVSTDALIRFADADTPVDDVRLLEDSLTVVDGVLRGMVRNWSRVLWAYEVTVTAHGRIFEWPLSVQPGEIAPFEIGAWDGPVDTHRIGIEVAARMVPEADLSRAFEFFFGRPWWGNAYDVPYDYPQHIHEALPQEGSHELYLAYAQFAEPDSHPWTADPGALAGWRSGDILESLVTQVRIDDLRAYLALFAYSYVPDSTEPSEPVVYELRQLDIVAPLKTAHHGTTSAVVDKWPISRIDLDWRGAVDPRLHVVFHVPNPRDDPEIIAELGVDANELAGGGLKWAIWIGAARDRSRIE